MTYEYLELLDWRRRVVDLFAELRRRPADEDTLRWFRDCKDELFRNHPQSPLPRESREAFSGLLYWPYDPSARVIATFEPVEAQAIPGPGSAHEDIPLARIGWLSFAYQSQACRLGAYWVLGYGGGLFVPVRDGTSGSESYGGGRYLLDSIKSADLGSDMDAGTVVLDFNYAYHPSCAYDSRWSCPLAPPDNWLDVPVRAGERLPRP